MISKTNLLNHVVTHSLFLVRAGVGVAEAHLSDLDRAPEVEHKVSGTLAGLALPEVVLRSAVLESIV